MEKLTAEIIKDTGMNEQEFKEFCEIMEGMEEVNAEMAQKMEEANLPPMCHFKIMEWDEGLWVCSTCGHTKEDESYDSDCQGYGY